MRVPTTFPEIIHIGYRTFRVVEKSALIASGAEKMGEMCWLSGEIRVRADLDEHEKANTLLHEILHAAYRNGALEDGDAEERIVAVLANQLSQVWKDNPRLAAYLGSAFGADA